MKIRHKETGEVIEGVIEGSHTQHGDGYFVDNDDPSVTVLYRKYLWERVPEERWVDVTKVVTWADPDNPCISKPVTLRYRQGVGYTDELVCTVGDGYRLRKVTICQGSVPGTPREVFIIERKECC